MKKLLVNSFDYFEVYAEFAKELGAKFENGVITYPPECIMEGRGHVFNMPNGIQVPITKVKANSPYEISRPILSADWYMLQMSEFEMTEPIHFKIGKDTLIDNTSNRAGIYITSCALDWSIYVPKNTKIRSLHIFLRKEWLAKYMHLTDEEPVFNKYLQLRAAAINYFPFDLELRKLFEELMEEEEMPEFRIMRIENIVMQILEMFFTKIKDRAAQSELKKMPNIKDDDVMRLMDIEAILVKDFRVPPPTIPELSRTAAMSVSKLKMLFKQVYGCGIYEYFQKYSLSKAREMIMTGDYSIKEVGMQLGYTNLSNFSLAFKKEFGVLPSELKPS
jgi:AraC-like DNA-binding protein